MLNGLHMNFWKTTSHSSAVNCGAGDGVVFRVCGCFVGCFLFLKYLLFSFMHIVKAVINFVFFNFFFYWFLVSNEEIHSIDINIYFFIEIFYVYLTWFHSCTIIMMRSGWCCLKKEEKIEYCSTYNIIV